MSYEQIPIEAFFGEDGIGPNASADTRRKLANAAIIWATDNIVLGRHVLVYGRKAGLYFAGQTIPQSVPLVNVELDFDNPEEFRRLLELIVLLRGRHEYTPRPTGSWGCFGGPDPPLPQLAPAA